MKKVFSIDFQLYKVTGVEKVMLDIHHVLQGEYEAKIVGNIPFSKVRTEHKIDETEYVQYNNLFMFHDSIVIVHERRLLFLFWVLNHFLFQRIKIVYVHHNVFHSHRFTTMLPETIVAIADSGIENLIHFFHADPRHIHKIYNCVIDEYRKPHAPMNKDIVTLLLPGRINDQKRQVEIVRQLTGKLDSRIRIQFAGDGPKIEELKKECLGKLNFEVLGFRNDVTELLQKVDFVLLFSAHEGLPITLIEATMVGMPIICNDVGGNAEICYDGENGFTINTWDCLAEVLNKLPDLSDDQYKSMCAASRRVYLGKFTYDLFKQRYLNLINSL